MALSRFHDLCRHKLSSAELLAFRSASTYSWFIIALLIALSLVQHFHAVAPRWSSTTVWITAAVTALLFFVTLLLHELAHSLVAKTRGLRVSAITLFALGDVSQIESEASDAKSEFWIAISGPLTSLAIGLALLGAARASAWVPGTEPRTAVTSVLVWLGYINLTLAVFNMIPGYPLDGGRVSRAIVWWITGDADRSTRLATQVGQAIAFFFILLGVSSDSSWARTSGDCGWPLSGGSSFMRPAPATLRRN